MSENFLKDFWRKTFLYRARGVSVARGMRGLFFYPEAGQQGVIIALSVIFGGMLALIAGEQQWPSRFGCEIRKVRLALAPNRNYTVTPGFRFLTANHVGLVIRCDGQGK